MSLMHNSAGTKLLRAILGDRTEPALATTDLDEMLQRDDSDAVSQQTLAAALNVVLFDDLLANVPSGAAYVAERRAIGERIRFDHGALRTIRFPDRSTGALPPGEAAFTRILEPLGYALAGLYPLPKLRMTGRAYVFTAAPEAMPQFFVSELHVEQFDDRFAAAAEDVFASSRDPIGDRTAQSLARLASDATLSFEDATAALADIVAAFGRQHDRPRLAAYETLLSQSAEAAWIATEGNAFNHATDRVLDLEALVASERAADRPIKQHVEVSASRRVRQTAHHAARVVRHFVGENGASVEREVPGSFYEFIARDTDPETGGLDLRFDSGNATGIFAMTRSDV